MTRHPLRNFEPPIKKGCKGENGTTDSLTLNEIENYYFQKIMALFVTRYEWKGLPPEIQPFFIEEVLFWRGCGAFVYDTNAEMYAFMHLALSGMPDIYNVPEDRWAYAVNGYLKEYGKTNSVILWDNPSAYPFCNTARMYSHSLALTWKTRDINMYAQRTPVALVSSDEQTLSYQIFGEEYDNLVPIIKLKDYIDIEKIKAIKLDAPYIVDKCEQEIRCIMSQVLTDLGYESNPTDKKERLVTDETHGNDGETEGMRNIGLSYRQRAANAISELWGLNVKVSFRSDLPTVVNGYKPPNMTPPGGEVVE